MIAAAFWPWALWLFGLTGAAAAGMAWQRRRQSPALRALAEVAGTLGTPGEEPSVPHAGLDDDTRALARALEHGREALGAQVREAQQLAYQDELTGLPNQAHLRESLTVAMTAGADGAAAPPFALLLLDLDHFKHLNDVLGPATADRLLVGAAERLRQVVREQDTLARLAGDAFAVLLPGAGADDARALAQRIATAFSVPLRLDDLAVDVSATAGVAVWPDHATDADGLLHCATAALAVSKRCPGGSTVYDSLFDAASQATLALSAELRQGIERGELRLYLQPRFDIASGALVGAEALVRWQHPERGLLQPLQFVPCAEQTALVRQLTLWVFEAVVAEQVALLALGISRVSVNLTGRDLLDHQLPEKLDAILRRHQAYAEAVGLEVTERALLSDLPRAEHALARLAGRGFRIALDDFGTGHTSLAALKRLPIHELKIDRSFVTAMEQDPGDAKLVRAAIDLAHTLGLHAVAEGVESEAILTQLHELNCDEGQGFHMSAPLPVAEFVAFAARWQARAPLMSGHALPGPVLLH